jgi:MarR family transcriptional regulator for hemolysin
MLPRVVPKFGPPIGLRLAGTAKTVRQAFDAALTAAGGSLPAWIVLLTVKTGSAANQRELAAAAGIQAATLTHHLNGMEREGLLTRTRDPANRRVHVVELTAQGEKLLEKLRAAAAAFDKRLRAGFDDAEIETLAALLDRLRANVGETSQEEGRRS